MRERRTLHLKIKLWTADVANYKFKTDLIEEARKINPIIRRLNLIKHIEIILMEGSDSQNQVAPISGSKRRISALAAYLNVQIDDGNAEKLKAAICSCNEEKQIYYRIFYVPIIENAELPKEKRLVLYVLGTILPPSDRSIGDIDEWEKYAEEIITASYETIEETPTTTLVNSIAGNLEKWIERDLKEYRYKEHVKVGLPTSVDEQLCNNSITNSNLLVCRSDSDLLNLLIIICLQSLHAKK